MFGRSKPTESQPPVPSSGQPIPPKVGGDPVEEFEQLWSPDQAAAARKSVEQLLLERGQVNEEQLVQAKTVQQQTPGKSIAQILLTMNASTEAQILSALAETLGLPFEVPEKATTDPAPSRCSSRTTSSSSWCCPSGSRASTRTTPSPARSSSA